MKSSLLITESAVPVIMSQMRPATAKILIHSRGLGTPHVDLVHERAEELARINGHESHTESDWQQAKHEMHGANQEEDDGAEEMGASMMVSGRDMVSTDVGHHLRRLPMEDDGNVVEELIREGMEEAEHERMLAARSQGEASDAE